LIPALIDYLALFAQTGNMSQVEVIARAMLASIPEDLVALQFLGLALYQMGRVDDAYRTFNRAARLAPSGDMDGFPVEGTASAVSYREATRANSGLAESWYRIARTLKSFGFHRLADRAFKAGQSSGPRAGVRPVCTGRP